MGYAPYKIPGKKYKYTTIFRDKRNGEVSQGHSDGRSWSEAALALLESIAKADREQGRTLTTVDDYEVLFVYPGYIKTLI